MGFSIWTRNSAIYRLNHMQFIIVLQVTTILYSNPYSRTVRYCATFASLSRCRYIISLSNKVFFLKGLKINAFWLLPFFNWTYHQFRFIKSEMKVRHDVWYWNKISGAILFRSEIAFSCNGNYYKWNMECGSRWPIVCDKKPWNQILSVKK